MTDWADLCRSIELVGGFPGSVLAELTYSLLPGGVWDIVLNANASARTRKPLYPLNLGSRSDLSL
jgi:hypothetical protein